MLTAWSTILYYYLLPPLTLQSSSPDLLYAGPHPPNNQTFAKPYNGIHTDYHEQSYRGKDVVRVTENELCVGRRRHLKLQSTYVDVTAERPEVRLLYAVDTIQL